jgi:hypothetical protein
LGALVIGSVVTLIRFQALLRLRRYSRPQFVLAWGTLFATLLLAPHLEQAIIYHGGEAARSRNRFLALPAADRHAIIAFLKTL